MRPSIFLLFLFIAPWAILAGGLLATGPGRTYLRSLGTTAATKEAMAVRDMGLAYAGLVFAGLALATTGPAGPDRIAACQLLSVAFAAAAISWTVSNLAPLTGAAVLSDAAILTSVAGILLAVLELLLGIGGLEVTVLVSLGAAYVILLTYSTYLAGVRWRESR